MDVARHVKNSILGPFQYGKGLGLSRISKGDSLLFPGALNFYRAWGLLLDTRLVKAGSPPPNLTKHKRVLLLIGGRLSKFEVCNPVSI